MSGFDLVKEVRRLVPDLAIALMTADASVEVAVRALRSEVDDFLPKPISPTQLVAQIDRLVERRRSTAGRTHERVLAVGAHPDDVEIGVGGILLGHASVGDRVTILTLSHGARGGDALRRADEAAKAAAMLGAELVLCDLEDTRLPESDPTVGLIEGAVARVRPTIVYTHTESDLHQDHRNVHRATLVAARLVPSVYCYESPSATVEFEPVRFVDIGEQLEAKLEAIGAYASQTEQRDYLDEELIRATARYWGRYGHSRFCEPLEVVRDRPAARVDRRRG
jgi:LmbE family N-acetylglucosaminyl deacetylase